MGYTHLIKKLGGSLGSLRTVQVLIHSGQRNEVFDKWKFRFICRTECVNNSVVGVVDDEVGRTC